jgi:hypothetical protein
MKLTSCLGVIAAVVVLWIPSARGADSRCDCTITPFEPDPPCADICIAKYLAIASLDDLRNIFGLPDDIAKMIAGIPSSRRPHLLEHYKRIISGPAFQVLEQRIHSLRAQDFEQVRINAKIRGLTLDGLQW